MNTASRIALVTGATRGIGLETVRQLAAAGVHVLLAGRDLERARAAAASLGDGAPVEPIALDVTDPASIAAAAGQVRARHGRLDILVNNAGILVDDAALKPSQQTPDTWRSTFETNLFAVVEVTRAFLPLLQASLSGRIVNVSSILASLALHVDPSSPIHGIKIPAYNASKSALNAFTVHLAWELRDAGIKVNAIHPGAVKTDMNPNAQMDVVDGARSSVAMALLDDDGPTGTFTHMGETLPW